LQRRSRYNPGTPLILDEGRQPIDLATLEALGEMVWPGGGGEEILRLVEEVKKGKVPHLLL
jgi:hypothetical protein